MSVFRRLVNLFRSPLRYVGRDLEGNKFYEHPSTSDDPRRTKRTVQYRREEEVWQYIGGGKRLPVQWSMWLTHTRGNPPTLEELQADAERQRRVLANVAMIEAREREEARLKVGRDLPEDVRLLNEGSPQPRVQVQLPSLPSESHSPPHDQVQQSSQGQIEVQSQIPSHFEPPQQPAVQKEREDMGHEEPRIDTPPKQSPFASRNTTLSGTDQPESWAPRTIRRGT